jgi:hypothetical protein
MEVLIDCNGLRVTAQPFFDLDAKVWYGSDDGGRTVQEHSAVHRALLTVAHQLHLAEHKVLLVCGYEMGRGWGRIRRCPMIRYQTP